MIIPGQYNEVLDDKNTVVLLIPFLLLAAIEPGGQTLAQPDLRATATKTLAITFRDFAL